MASLPRTASVPLARQAREQFVACLQAGLGPLSQALGAALEQQVNGPNGSARQELRQALAAFERARPIWVAGVQKAWRRALAPASATGPIRVDQLELIGDQVVENKILASRLAMGMHEQVQWELNDVKLRIEHLEGVDELPSEDILRPEAAALLLVEQWMAADLSSAEWIFAKDFLRKFMAQCALGAYQKTNEFLLAHGVLPEIELRSRVKRSAHAPAVNGTLDGPAHSVRGEAAGSSGQGSAEGPFARARARAAGVLDQLKRVLNERISGFDARASTRPSPRLAQALTHYESQLLTEFGSQFWSQAQDSSGVERVARELRERSAQLKQSAEAPNEKATIEIVALMFQNILSEERIAPALRVWFARLQMPVLRVALAEPQFFSSLNHPARQLIDRMGSCALGFDAAAINGSALEAEVRRVVQVIEQYPETGQRVFELVYEEFEAFLAKFLTASAPTQRLVSVAQQVEQKETLAIQYTIELRKMLSEVPVREEIRDFLFKVWAEVLALATIKHGPQDADTVGFKKAAADLVWAACAKPNREERTRVIQQLPELLLKLSDGMSMLGVPGSEQEAYIRTISDALADAFRAQTHGIAQSRIDEMAMHLAHLEDFLSDEAPADLSLDRHSMELMLGMEASAIEVIGGGSAEADEAMLASAQQLPLGAWFSLDHNGQQALVQYAWRSLRGQLHLLATADGRGYLIQLRRLAAYLQSGLLVPSEEEALTVRATRDALVKLGANPERLLH